MRSSEAEAPLWASDGATQRSGGWDADKALGGCPPNALPWSTAWKPAIFACGGIGGMFLTLSGIRQPDDEGGAAAGLAFHLDRSAVGRHKFLGDGEPQSRSSPASRAGRVGPVEPVEEMGEMFRFDADARVRNAHPQHVLLFLRSFFPVNADVHRSSLGGVAKRVDQQVEKHLRDPVRVDGKGRFAGKVVEREMNSLFGGLGTDALQNSPQKGGNVRWFPFQGQLLRLRQGQLMKILDEAGETDQFVLQGQKVFRLDRPA